MKTIKILIIIFLILLLIPFIINGIVIFKTKDKIINIEDIDKKYDIAMVLGCGIKNNEPSLMLKDRLNKAIELYNAGLIKNILVSGDEHENYNEVEVMINYLLENNIPSEIILKDSKGFNTSNSIENYANLYKDKSLIIVTQKYHMYRSLYIAIIKDIDVIGVSAKSVRYHGQFIRDIREILARFKDYLKYLF